MPVSMHGSAVSLTTFGGFAGPPATAALGYPALGVAIPFTAPGIKINTSSTDFYLIEQMQMSRFNGETFLPFGWC